MTEAIPAAASAATSNEMAVTIRPISERRPNYMFDVSDINISKTKTFGRSETQIRNPLNPTYKLPSQAPIKYPEPKFIRSSLDVSDIERASPYVHLSHLPTNHRQLDISDIRGTSSRPQHFARTRGVIPNSLDTSDIMNQHFKTQRQTNPLEPRYIYAVTPAQALQSYHKQLQTETGDSTEMKWMHEPQYGDVDGSHPKAFKPARQDKNLFALRSTDIPGAAPFWSKNNSPYPRSTWHRLPRPTNTIVGGGAQPRVGPTMKTSRHLNPGCPEYDLKTWIGEGTELANPNKVDPKMQKYMDKHNQKSAPVTTAKPASPTVIATKTAERVSSSVPATEEALPPTSVEKSVRIITPPKTPPSRTPPPEKAASSQPNAVPATGFTTAMSAGNAADAASIKAEELRQKALALHEATKPQGNHGAPRVNNKILSAPRTQMRYPSTSISEDPTTSSPLIVDLAPTGKNYFMPSAAAPLGFEYTDNNNLADSKCTYQLFNQTATGRLSIPSKMSHSGSRAQLASMQSTRTSAPSVLSTVPPVSYWASKGITESGPSSSLQSNGVVFKNYKQRKNFTRRAADIASVRSLPTK